MSFRPGLYTIASNIEGSERYVSRAPVEDRSLLPKRIWALSSGIQDPSRGIWLIRSIDGYIDLEIRGAHTGVVNLDRSKPFAFLIDVSSEIGWILEPARSPGTFKIKTKDGLRYWQTSGEEEHFGQLIVLAERSDDPRQEFIFRFREDED
ncbi:uncharacterized protein DFL_003454 [Arthrobotrys flagrans]|uniref:Ricin B lectin domain-containing protein n=1 Tax=Arthrobotrys flagrans TaxID=97331 RepID=A0A437A1V1_ARTFL|nr:hypothetical protein DFL_003454 [Arthrobotrys flagrans]